MRAITHDGIPFEVPDAWLAAVGYAPPTGPGDHYRSTRAQAVIELAALRTPRRDDGVTWFHEDNMCSVLTAMLTGADLPPIDVARFAADERPVIVRDGFHRYHASIVMGYRRIPVRQVDY
jgi:hypothetical protein